MNLKVDSYNSLYYSQVLNNKVKTNKNVNFQGTEQRTLRKIGYSLLAISMMAYLSCKNKNRPLSSAEEQIKTELNDRTKSLANENSAKKPQKFYYYYPSDNDVDAGNYAWSETIYPDGSVQKDSLGYQISINPNGARTVVHSEKDEKGNVITETDLPDSTKIVKTDYQTSSENEIMHSEQIYWANGKLKEDKYYCEHSSDSSDINAPKVKESEIKKFNENGVLIYWESDFTSKERNDSNNTYDRHGRLIYDDVKNEKYQYKGKNTTPFRSTSELDDCLRITEYNKDGSVKKVFFKASDGTITKQ